MGSVEAELLMVVYGFFPLPVASIVRRVRRGTYDAGGGGIRSVEGVLVGAHDVSEDSADRGQSSSIYDKHNRASCQHM